MPAPDDDIRTPQQREALDRLATERGATVDHAGYRPDGADRDWLEHTKDDGMPLDDAPQPRMVLLFWLSDGAKGEITAEGTITFGRPGSIRR